MQESKRYLRLKLLQDKYSISRSKIYSDVKKGLFPPPFKLGYSSIWSVDEIETLLRYESIEKRSDEKIREFVNGLILARK